MGNNYLLSTVLKRRTLFIITFLFLFVFSLSSSHGNEKEFNKSLQTDSNGVKIHFIDVGEGEAIFLETLQGENALIDTGNIISGYKLVNYLKEINVTSLDYLILTHMHPDHIGGSFFVAQMLDIKNIYDNGENISKDAVSGDLYDTLYHWYNQLIRKSTKWKSLKAGDSLTIGNVNISVLWPSRPFPFPGSNPSSLVLMGQLNNFKTLLSADVPTYVEAELLKKGYDLKANVLKVGHHGNNDATSEEYIEAISPEVSIICINKDNVRGYPSDEVVDRLRRHNSDIYRTYQDGTIVINVSDNGDYTVTTEKK